MKIMQAEYRVSQDQVRLAADRPVRYQRFASVIGAAPHDHESYEICFVLGGRGRHCTPHFDSEMVRGSVLVLAPGQVHAIRRAENLSVINLYYLDEWLLGDAAVWWDNGGVVELFLLGSLIREVADFPVRQFYLENADRERCERELADLDGELRRDRPALPYLRATLWKLFTTIARVADPEKSGTVRGWEAGLHVRNAMYRIEEHLYRREPLQVGLIARELGLSADHLARLFKADTGWTPKEYLQRRRIHQAMALLLDPRKNLTEIAYDLGYADSAHFSRSFRKVRGQSPSDYRRRFVTGPSEGGSERFSL